MVWIDLLQNHVIWRTVNRSEKFALAANIARIIVLQQSVLATICVFVEKVYLAFHFLFLGQINTRIYLRGLFCNIFFFTFSLVDPPCRLSRFQNGIFTLFRQIIWNLVGTFSFWFIVFVSVHRFSELQIRHFWAINRTYIPFWHFLWIHLLILKPAF